MHGLSGAGGPTTSFPTARVMYRTVLAPPPVVKKAAHRTARSYIHRHSRSSRLGLGAVPFV